MDYIQKLERLQYGRGRSNSGWTLIDVAVAIALLQAFDLPPLAWKIRVVAVFGADDPTVDKAKKALQLGTPVASAGTFDITRDSRVLLAAEPIMDNTQTGCIVDVFDPYEIWGPGPTVVEVLPADAGELKRLSGPGKLLDIPAMLSET